MPLSLPAAFMLWSCENGDGGLPSATLSIPGCQDPHLQAGARFQPVPLVVPPLIVPYMKHPWSPKQGLSRFSQPVSTARATRSSRWPPHNLSGASESLCLCRSLRFHSPDVVPHHHFLPENNWCLHWLHRQLLLQSVPSAPVREREKAPMAEAVWAKSPPGPPRRDSFTFSSQKGWKQGQRSGPQGSARCGS